MTREERAKYLNQLIIPDLFDNSQESCELRMKQEEALYETIAELMQEPYEELDFVQPHKKISVNLELCDDAISRQAVIEVLNKMDRYVADELTLCDTERKFPKNEVFIVDDVYEEIVEQLPSVKLKQRTGE